MPSRPTPATCRRSSRTTRPEATWSFWSESLSRSLPRSPSSRLCAGGFDIPRGLAGIPRARLERIAAGDRRHLPPIIYPTLATVAGSITGFAVAGWVKQLVDPVQARDTRVVLANNLASIAGGLLRALNAGICEEIMIVALPVLLGCRAGWRPSTIFALSVLLRWPFHIYHGLYSSIPWVIIWGGANAALYLWLRRLWPLVLVHVFNDLVSLYHSSNWPLGIVFIVAVAFAVWMGVRAIYLDPLRRRRNCTTPTGRSVTYVPIANGAIFLASKSRNIPDIWQAAQAIRADYGSPFGAIHLSPPKRSPQAHQLAAHGYPRSRLGGYRVPLTAISGENDGSGSTSEPDRQ